MRRWLYLAALLPAISRAALVQTQAVIRTGPASPVPVIGNLSFSYSATPSMVAAPSLKGVLSTALALPVAPAPIVPVAQPQVQTLQTIAAAPLVAPAPQAQPEKGAEQASAQAALRFDGGASLPAAPVAAAEHAPRLIITGPPGSGKGTYSERIAKDYGVIHISVGELLRDYAKAHPDVAKVMATGALVDSKLVLNVVAERLSRPDIKERGFILDGFPRRTEEAAALEKMLGPAPVDGVIELGVPETELLRRILARGRADDKPDVFKERMRIYREQTVPAVERFKKTAPVLAPEVSGSDAESNYARVKAALGGLLDKILGR